MPRKQKTETVGVVRVDESGIRPSNTGRRVQTDYYEVDKETDSIKSVYPAPNKPGQMRVDRMESFQGTGPRGRTVPMSKVPKKKRK